jgi:hypothetical protein
MDGLKNLKKHVIANAQLIDVIAAWFVTPET